MSALLEARRILATDPPILLSTPEWRALVRRLVEQIETDQRYVERMGEVAHGLREAALR